MRDLARLVAFIGLALALFSPEASPEAIGSLEPPRIPGAGAPQESADSPVPQRPEDPVQVFLITAGPGDAVWERFGHNAIWIVDRQNSSSVAYNWGVFSFFQEDFVPRLVRGTMLYSMRPVVDPDAFLAGYRHQDRRVWLQELALTPGQKADLQSFVEWNARPENRDYRYDYYRDNCSTRVRDALDRVLGGRLKAEFDSVVTPATYRWHTRRLLGGLPQYYLGIQTVLGPRADPALSAWEEMFLPVKLMEWIREVEVPDEDGILRPLVVRDRLLFDSATREPEAAGPPRALPWFLLVGVLWGGLLLLLTRGDQRMGWARRSAVGILGGGWGIVGGLAGTLLLAAWLFTDHSFWYRNFNLFQVNPLDAVLAAGYMVFLVRGRFPRWSVTIAIVLLAISVAGLLFQIMPGFGQRNAEFLALAVPSNLGMVLAALRLGGWPGRESDSLR